MAIIIKTGAEESQVIDNELVSYQWATGEPVRSAK